MAKEIKIDKTVTINKPRQVVFDYIKYCRNMENYSVWNMADPDKKTETKGQDGTPGFVYSWDSKNKNVGAGEQEILHLEDGKSIDYALRFQRPMKNTAASKYTLNDSQEGQTNVTWSFVGPVNFPMSLFSGFLAKMLGKDMQKSLDNLKRLLEA